MTAQWVQLGGGETLVASREGAWIQRPQAAALELWGAMPPSHGGSLETTRHLLDGALSAGERGATPATAWPPTARRWALDLIDQWYTAHHSVALLPAAIERYECNGRHELAHFARRKLGEETGHDQLPLNDLRVLGYDAEAAVQQVPPGPTARGLVHYARKCVAGPHPVGFFGYIYALERRVIRITEEELRTLDEVLPSGLKAASGVRAHAIEFDHEHVEELVAFVTGLPADERTAIALACYETATILSRALSSRAAERLELDRGRRLARFHSPTIPAEEPRSEP